MDYIQAVFAKGLSEYKQILLNKNNTIKNEIIEHCKCELLADFINVTMQDDGSLSIEFPDLKLQIESQEKFAFNDKKEIGLQTNFYYDNEYIFSMVINHTGKVYFADNFKEEYPVIDYDDTGIPLILIHGILSAAHRNGTILLVE